MINLRFTAIFLFFLNAHAVVKLGPIPIIRAKNK